MHRFFPCSCAPRNDIALGSCLQAVRALERPRWEDFNYELFDVTKNRFYWLGDGSTHNEKYMTGDRKYFHSSGACIYVNNDLVGAWYLNPSEVDIPPGRSYKDYMLKVLSDFFFQFPNNETKLEIYSTIEHESLFIIHMYSHVY